MSAVHLAHVLERHRDPKKQRVKVPMPWDEGPKGTDVTADERVALRESLRRRSAFRD